MNTNMKLFTVTSIEKVSDREDRMISIPVAHVVSISPCRRFSQYGEVTTSTGGSVETKETYAELISKWGRLTNN